MWAVRHGGVDLHPAVHGAGVHDEGVVAEQAAGGAVGGWLAALALVRGIGKKAVETMEAEASRRGVPLFRAMEAMAAEGVPKLGASAPLVNGRMQIDVLALSGGGSDGALGAKAIKEAGGVANPELVPSSGLQAQPQDDATTTATRGTPAT